MNEVHTVRSLLAYTKAVLKDKDLGDIDLRSTKDALTRDVLQRLVDIP